VTTATKRRSRKATPRRASSGVPAKWRKLFRTIPGYDPIKTAGACTFDAEAADRVCKFFEECLTHTKGELAGQPLRLEGWEQAIVGCVFGWKRPDGTRRYREVFVFVPRKNGKTTFAAGLVNYMLFCDGEPGAEIYCAAADRDQASLVYGQAKEMVLHEPVLDRIAKIMATSKTVLWEAQNSFYRAISAEANTKHGYNVHAAVIDELHAQPNRELVDVLMTATGSRRQPLVLHITTSDYDRPSICNEKLDYAEKVRDGIFEDPSFLPAIWAASVDDDWTDPAVWAMCNPNLGVSLDEEYLRRECRRAQEVPAFENTFKRLHLNIKTEQAMRWLPMEAWDACACDLDESSLIGKKCYAGLDLSTTTDLTALALYFPDECAVLPFFWVPEDSAHERERRDRVPYETWARQGLITLTPGNVVDYGFVIQQFETLAGRFKILETAYDPWNATQTALDLQAKGHTMIEFRQGFVSMNEPSKRLETMIVGHTLRHSGHAVLRWNAANVSVLTDPAGNLKPTKEKSTGKIDGIVALIMALGRSMVTDCKQGSVYDRRGLVVIG